MVDLLPDHSIHTRKSKVWQSVNQWQQKHFQRFQAWFSHHPEKSVHLKQYSIIIKLHSWSNFDSSKIWTSGLLLKVPEDFWRIYFGTDHKYLLEADYCFLYFLAIVCMILRIPTPCSGLWTWSWTSMLRQENLGTPIWLSMQNWQSHVYFWIKANSNLRWQTLL